MNIGRRSFFQRLSALLAGPILPNKVMAELSQPADPPVDLPPDDELWLAEWQGAARIPICDSDDPKERRLLRALRLAEPVEFIYYAGTSPGEPRRIRPAMLYRVEGFPGVYLTGYCELRKENRTFRLDRVQF
jgi:predicted DNA-binding transcriptional regulator YafY